MLQFCACYTQNKPVKEQKQFFVLAPKFFLNSTSVAFTQHFIEHFAIVIALNMNKQNAIQIPLCRQGYVWHGQDDGNKVAARKQLE